jgi:hypothetical protein
MPAIEMPTGYTRDEWTGFLKRGRRVIRTKNASNFELGDFSSKCWPTGRSPPAR